MTPRNVNTLYDVNFLNSLTKQLQKNVDLSFLDTIINTFVTIVFPLFGEIMCSHRRDQDEKIGGFRLLEL